MGPFDLTALSPRSRVRAPQSATPDAGSHILLRSHRGDVRRRHRGRRRARRAEHHPTSWSAWSTWRRRSAPTQALRDCSFELRAGEVHALVGENGSGKSTLVKILSGVHAPDAGRVELAGAQAQLRSPKAAQERGIVTVFQEVLVAESRSVLDNVWLGADDTWRTRVPAREKRRPAKAALEELLGQPLDLSTRGGGALAQRPPGLLHRAGPAAQAAHPDPRRGDVGARRGHARPPVRADRRPRRRGRRA